jgi:hypothetical protein
LNAAALSLAVYGVYLLANGLGLLLAPSVPFALLGVPFTEDPWVRVLGLVAGEIGFYFVYAARADLSSFYRATVYARGTAALVFLVLVALKLGPVQLLLFAAVDLLSAIWTHFALRSARAA